MTGTGKTVLQATNQHDLFYLDGGWTVENQGTWTGDTATVVLGAKSDGTSSGAGYLTNDLGATIDFTNTSGSIVAVDVGAGGGTFSNAGLLQKDGGGQTLINATLNNTGTISIAGGELDLDGGGTSAAGGFTFAAATLLGFNNGSNNTFTVSGGTFGANANLSVYGGTLDIAGTTTLNGNLTLAAGGTLAIDAGTMTVTGAMTGPGSISVASGASFVFNGAGTAVGNQLNITSGTGHVALYGGSGNDVFAFGGNFRAGDVLSGGAGSDSLILNGDYATGVSLNVSTLASIDTLTLLGGHSYKLTSNDANVAAAQTLTVDASALGAGDKLIFRGQAESNGQFSFIGGAGNDVLTGGAGNDTFDLSEGGRDTATGGGGDDTFALGATLTTTDRIDGGTGSNTVVINGDYSAGVNFTNDTMINIAAIDLTSGYSYRLTTHDATVAAGQTLAIDGSGLGASDTLVFKGSAETDGQFSITGGAGNDAITGGAGNDTFDLSFGGNDVARGGGGDDTFDLGGAFGKADRIDGGAGNNTVVLDGDYSSRLSFSPVTMINVQMLELTAGHSYNMKSDNGTVAAGQTLAVDGAGLAATDKLIFDGSAETDGKFVFKAGLEEDRLTAGAGDDQFVYGSAAGSTGKHHDTIGNFDFSHDSFVFHNAVTGIDTAISTGTLSTSSFNNDLAAAVNGSTLGAGHAVLFTANAGNLAGHTFLVVDMDGSAGYQSGHDLVVELVGAQNTNQLSTSDFILG